MIKNIDRLARQQIIDFLPVAISKALESYEEFINLELQEGSKEFLAHHNACKAAIAHLELLLKLVKWADTPDNQLEDSRHVSELLEVAIQRVERNNKENQE